MAKQEFKRIRYFCQDESRFGLKTSIGRVITLSGVKPLGTWQWQFKAFWLYGAVEPMTKEQFFLQFSHVDSDCYQRFLNEFSATYSDTLNILQVDNGAFHKAKNLSIPNNIILLFQPAYCQATFWGEASPQKLAPELNPIERLWQHLKKYLHWDLFKDLTQLQTFSGSTSCPTDYRNSCFYHWL